MSRAQRRSLLRQSIRPAALCGVLLVHAAVAQEAAPAAPRTVTIELIDRLAAGGLLPAEDAAALRAQAAQEAHAVLAELTVARRAAAEAAEAAAEAARQLRHQLLATDEGAGTGALGAARLSAEQAAQRAELAAARTRASLAAVSRFAGEGAAEAAADDGAVRVTYVPEVVKEELREEIRQQVMAQAYEEKWAAPRAYPDWLSRFKFFADVRARGEGVLFPAGNDTNGAPPNFNSVNTGSPFNLADTTVYFPRYNVDQDRERLRLRVRLGVAGDLGDGFTAGLRLATGENNSPVSPNQSLGAASGQGGQFSKYSVWLDRGFLKYERGLGEGGSVALTAGRFDNPFLATDMIWDDDLGFDGVAAKVGKRLGDWFTPFATVGAFPVYNTDFNFASNRATKFPSDDKWLYGGQAGLAFQFTRDLKLTVAGAVYDFHGVEGRASTAYIPLTTADAGDTDATRPSFAQKGNTYRALRTIDNSTALNNYGASSQYHYFGLATKFREVAGTVKLDYDRFAPFQVSLIGEYVRNTAFDPAAVATVAVNNLGVAENDGDPVPQLGGNTGWAVALKFGDAALQRRWAWNATVGYRRVETDAVIDGFADSDFGGGGTNLKGFTLGGNLALSPRVWLGLRWLSADQVDGSTFKNDTLQIDLNGKF